MFVHVPGIKRYILTMWVWFFFLLNCFLYLNSLASHGSEYSGKIIRHSYREWYPELFNPSILCLSFSVTEKHILLSTCVEYMTHNACVLLRYPKRIPFCTYDSMVICKADRVLSYTSLMHCNNVQRAKFCAEHTHLSGSVEEPQGIAGNALTWQTTTR